MNVLDQAVTFITKAWPAHRIVASGADFQTMSQLEWPSPTGYVCTFNECLNNWFPLQFVTTVSAGFF